MSEAIDEIQSKDRRQKGLDAWAEMLARIHSRGPAEARVQEEAVSGGSSLPPQQKVVDPRAAEKKARMIEQAKARQVAEAEMRRMADKVVVTQEASKPAPKVALPEAPKAAPARPAPAPPAAAAVKASAPVATSPEGNEPAAAVATPEVKSSPADRMQENAAAAVEEVRQLSSLAGLDTLEKEVSEPAAEPATPAEEALRLAQLRSGVGANPELAAKDYVLASELPGVKDTLQGGIYEEFRVAL